MRRFLDRLGLAVAVAAVAIVCLSSEYLAAAVGITTAAIVAIDMIAFRRPPSDPPDDRLNVDLSRRR